MLMDRNLQYLRTLHCKQFREELPLKTIQVFVHQQNHCRSVLSFGFERSGWDLASSLGLRPGSAQTQEL